MTELETRPPTAAELRNYGSKGFGLALSGILHQKPAEMPMSAFTAQINTFLQLVDSTKSMESRDALKVLEKSRDPIFKMVKKQYEFGIGTLLAARDFVNTFRPETGTSFVESIFDDSASGGSGAQAVFAVQKMPDGSIKRSIFIAGATPINEMANAIPAWLGLSIGQVRQAKDIVDRMNQIAA